MQAPDQLLTISDVERLAETPRHTIFAALAAGELRAVRDHRFRVRVTPDDLAAWVAERERATRRR